MSISCSKTFYTLDESRAFESDPHIKIVYFTEKGIDLLAVIPEAAHIDYATRMGYSWYHIINNPPSFVVKSQQSQQSQKQVRIVRTTEAELATHTSARQSQQQSQQSQIKLHVDHKAAMLAEIDALPTSELTQDRLADVITDYMIKHGIHDFVIADEICVILGNRGILKASESESVISAAADVEAVVDKTSFDEDVMQYSIGGHDQTVSSIGSISAWLVSSFDSVVTSVQQLTLNILPIPSNTDWILVD